MSVLVAASWFRTRSWTKSRDSAKQSEVLREVLRRKLRLRMTEFNSPLRPQTSFARSQFQGLHNRKMKNKIALWIFTAIYALSGISALYAEQHLKSFKLAIANPTDQNRPAE